MFYKGLVTIYDKVTKKGHIVLLDNEQELIFASADFPNSNIAPHIGERIKCSIIEKNGVLHANLIVRLDYKNAAYTQEIEVKKNSFDIVRQSMTPLVTLAEDGIQIDKQADLQNSTEQHLPRVELNINAVESVESVESVVPLSPPVQSNSLDIAQYHKSSTYQNLKAKFGYRHYKAPTVKEGFKKNQRKSNGVNWWWIVLGLIGLLCINLALYTYKRYQHYQQDQAIKLNKLTAEQKQQVAEQRRALGRLPNKILSNQALDELLGKTREK